MVTTADHLRPTPLEVASASRLSLQPACGLPSPISSSFHQSQSAKSGADDAQPNGGGGEREGEEDEYTAQGDNTLISCLTHLSLASLPSPGGSKGGPVVTRFPQPPQPRESSALGTREEQRRIYLGPKLSDRATGGPDAGPLIERFSCLFKDRERYPYPPPSLLPFHDLLVSCLTCRISLQEQP